jgi:hypothetical protein
MVAIVVGAAQLPAALFDFLSLFPLSPFSFLHRLKFRNTIINKNQP